MTEQESDLSYGPTCNICGKTVFPEFLLDHLRDAHGVDEEIATWPDGEPVIVDKTLQPDDFAGGHQ